VTELSQDAKKVLRALTERASDGYSLISRTGLTMAELAPAVRSLIDMGLIAIQGEPRGEEIAKAYLWVPPDAQGKADYFLGKLVPF